MGYGAPTPQQPFSPRRREAAMAHVAGRRLGNEFPKGRFFLAQQPVRERKGEAPARGGTADSGGRTDGHTVRQTDSHVSTAAAMAMNTETKEARHVKWVGTTAIRSCARPANRQTVDKWRRRSDTRSTSNRGERHGTSRHVTARHVHVTTGHIVSRHKCGGQHCSSLTTESHGIVIAIKEAGTMRSGGGKQEKK